MKTSVFSVFLSAISVFLSVSVSAQLSLDRIFEDHMIFQREKQVRVWGKGSPGTSVSLSFKDQNKRTVVAGDSSWGLMLDPLAASSSPSEMKISSGGSQLVIRDILVGDIWLCIGQSNMEWPMSQEEHYAEERTHLPNSKLRFYDPVYAGQGIFGTAFSDSVLRSLNSRDFYNGHWATCDSNSIKGMSAVGYYFGKSIATETGVPIGLINLAIGGAPIETFISREALTQQFPSKVSGNWLENDALPVWVRQRGRENLPASSLDRDHAFKPGFAFEAGIRPFGNFPIKGIIWYQGESNAQEIERVMEYASLQSLLVRSLRENWRDSTLAFYYAQLSSIDSLGYRSQLWPLFRDEQRKMMNLDSRSGMAVTSDHGAMHDVHPRNKKIVGERLAKWALVQNYGAGLTPSGPLPLRAIRSDSTIRIFFRWGAGLQTDGPLRGFSLNGRDSIAATIEDSNVVIHLPAAADAHWVYYGWKPYSNGNLFNGAGLPASTFRLPIEPVPALIPLPRHVTCTGGLSKSPLSKSRLSKSLPPEGYRISATADSIVIVAGSEKGLFYARQTLEQLRKGDLIEGCEIEDWPSFPWRGYMVDVGRNFMSMDLLKQQIDVMAKYKLNVFHFHLTEDIAWRIEIPGFPQLTKAATMMRNPGSYYGVKDMKELMRYCKDRNITMLPEIDMPGHSAAFERAMGFKMQSPEGKAAMKKILESFCKTYDLEYIHIGGDEVKISDSSFLPEMVRFLQAKGKKVIGWDPGGNLGNQVTRQLWMAKGAEDSSLNYIDSRHLYINHMDPEESVVTIFHRRLGNTDSATRNVRGATLCLWHDRNVRSEADLMIMNPVYPAMLAFAEKSWRGGGYPDWITNTPDPASFAEFEKRLIDHKHRNFSDKPFPYWKQSNITWDLYGPYPNGGQLERNFFPDTTLLGLRPTLQATGSTIILRHFWHPLVKGTLSTSKTSTSKTATLEVEENTTWYAATQLWSEADTTARFRIGFNNFSRSYVTDSPREGTWNNLNSKIYINDEEIAPPKWKQAGAKATLELPLVDEGYEYREPHYIKLKKGWNRIVVKLPVGQFTTTSFGNPVKWMFTVVKED